MIEKKISLGQEAGSFTMNDLIQAPDSYFLEINVLGLLEESDREDVLNLVCSKLRKGGLLVLRGIDCLELCRRTFYGEISIEQFSKIAAHMKRATSLVSLKDYFRDRNWKVKYAGLKQEQYFFEVVKDE